jgi:hypothetical protein
VAQEKIKNWFSRAGSYFRSFGKLRRKNFTEKA